MHTKVRHLMESVALLTPKLQVYGISQKTACSTIADQDVLCGSVVIKARVLMSLIQGIRIMC